MADLKELYSSYFDIVRLKNELNVLYTLDEYKKKSVNEFFCTLISVYVLSEDGLTDRNNC
jgi:hypothetical protein